MPVAVASGSARKASAALPCFWDLGMVDIRVHTTRNNVDDCKASSGPRLRRLSSQLMLLSLGLGAPHP